MNPQKNKASPKRPQFLLPELLKVALLPGHWRAWQPRYKRASWAAGLITRPSEWGWAKVRACGCEQPVAQGLHFFRSEQLDVSGWLTQPVVLADRAKTAIWSQCMLGCK